MAERQWDETSFFDELRRKRGDAACAVARSILGWCARQGYEVEYGLGAAWGTLKPCVHHGGKKYVLFEVFTPGFILLASYLWDEAPFTQAETRKELVGQLNHLPLKKSLPADAYNDRPRIWLDKLDAGNVSVLERVHEWVVGRIRA